MVYPTTITTPKLLLQKPDTAHDTIEDVYSVCGDPDTVNEITTHVPWAEHQTRRDSEQFLEEQVTKWNDRECATYILRDHNHHFLGIGSLHTDWDAQRGELGCWLRKSAWGNGYSVQRAKALIELGFDHFDLQVIGVGHLAENTNSEKAIKRYMTAVGGEYTGTERFCDVDWNGHPDDKLFTLNTYEVLQADYTDTDPASVIENIRFTDRS